tara:strand:- start:1411 stop:2277 length:867 start_codon:yes stop_codon:yes gene_type:complete
MTNQQMPTSVSNGARQPFKSNTPNLNQLVQKCSYIAIENGKLILEAKSGKPIPPDWFKEHALNISIEMAKLTSERIFQYESFDTGRYGKHKSNGITLQFINLSDNKEAYIVFNAELSRDRTTRHGMKGDPLPNKQFRVREGHSFYRFWVNTGLKTPSRLSKFSDYMGNLKPVLFTGQYNQQDLKREKLDKQSITPLTISHQSIIEALNNSHNSRTNHEHKPHNVRTTSSHKEMANNQQPQGQQVNIATGENWYGKRLQGNAVISQANSLPKAPADQTPEEWLYDYEQG